MEMGKSLNPEPGQGLSGLRINSEDVDTIMYPLIGKLLESVALEWSRCLDVDGSESDLKFTFDFLYREIYRLKRMGNVCLTMHQSGHHPLEQESTISSVSVLCTSSNIGVAPQSSTGTLGQQQFQFTLSQQQSLQAVQSGYQSVHGALLGYQMQNINKQRHLWSKLVITHKASCPEMEQIGKGRPSQRMSTLGKFHLFLDVLLVQGRIQYLDFNYGTKHPIKPPLPQFSLLVRLQHVYLRRVGLETSKYCVPCQRYGLRTCNQVGVPLPSDIVRQVPPFSVCGMDCTGPLCFRGSSNKYYLLLCTCVTTRRIHLKLRSSWNLPDFIYAFRKLAARQGVPTGVYSDNACTLAAAATELSRIYGIHAPTWRQIVQHTPWWGVWWKQLICLVKSTHHKTVGNRSLIQQVSKEVYIKLPSNLGKGPLTSACFLRGQLQDERLEMHDLLDRTVLIFLEIFANYSEFSDKISYGFYKHLSELTEVKNNKPKI